MVNRGVGRKNQAEASETRPHVSLWSAASSMRLCHPCLPFLNVLVWRSCSVFDYYWLLGLQRDGAGQQGQEGGAGNRCGKLQRVQCEKHKVVFSSYGGNQNCWPYEMDQSGVPLHKNVTLTRKVSSRRVRPEKAREGGNSTAASEGRGTGDWRFEIYQERSCRKTGYRKACARPRNVLRERELGKPHFQFPKHPVATNAPPQPEKRKDWERKRNPVKNNAKEGIQQKRRIWWERPLWRIKMKSFITGWHSGCWIRWIVSYHVSCLWQTV